MLKYSIMKKIFITGSTGYIGQLLVNKLLKEGNTVHALMRNLKKSPFKPHPNLIPLKGDVLDYSALLKGMKGCTFVYHLAAYAKSWARNSDTFYQVNVMGTNNLLEVAKLLGVEKVVVTSTCSVLGPSDDIPLEESSSRELPFFNHYEKSKHLVER